MSAIIAGIGLALTAASMIGSFAQGQASASAQKKALKLQQKQFELDLKKTYLSSLDQLTQLEGAFKDTQTAILQTESDIASADEFLKYRYDNYYSTQLAGTIESGMGEYQTLMQNWQNRGVLTAERGQTGSTASILAAIQRQSLANFAGEDLSLDANGGRFGGLLTEQIRDLEAEKKSAENRIDIGNQSLALYQDTLNDYLRSIGTTLGSAVALGYDSGQSYEALAELVDQYKDYFGDVSESEFNSIKADLLKDYAPLDYRVTSYTYETESGGESQHGATIHEHTGYITWVKNEDGMWVAATGDQLKKLKKQYGKNYVKDYINANGVVNLGDYNAKATVKNGVYGHQQNSIIWNDTFQKKIESLGSRPK